MHGSRKKVFVGVSGGVDSSVSAALLRDAGHDVESVFIKVWQPDFIPCTAAADRLDAMRVAAHLGIPFRTLDLEREYKEGVLDHLLAEYARGRTPNPDALCNREVKFGAFLAYALAEGADGIATGHYARIDSDGVECRLLAGTDAAKDQSYFLWMLDQRALGKTAFPVGHLEKKEVRRLAAKFGLPTAEKKDSQGLCFIGDVDMKEFLARYLKPERGAVLDEHGREIGKHDGSVLYTIGERHGFTVRHRSPEEPPLYIVAKDIGANTITVGPKKSGERGGLRVELSGVNRISPKLAPGGRLSMRARYHAPLAPCVLESTNGGRAVVHLDSPDTTLAPGQAMVFYDGDECLGGGTIEKAFIR